MTTELEHCQPLIRELRMLLEDNEDQREGGGVPQTNLNIWTDGELLEYLKIALGNWNAYEPKFQIVNLHVLAVHHSRWIPTILWGAIDHALFALMVNWEATNSNQSEYKIGDLLISCDKAERWKSLKERAECRWDMAVSQEKREG